MNSLKIFKKNINKEDYIFNILITNNAINNQNTNTTNKTNESNFKIYSSTLTAINNLTKIISSDNNKIEIVLEINDIYSKISYKSDLIDLEKELTAIESIEGLTKSNIIDFLLDNKETLDKAHLENFYLSIDKNDNVIDSNDNKNDNKNISLTLKVMYKVNMFSLCLLKINCNFISNDYKYIFNSLHNSFVLRNELNEKYFIENNQLNDIINQAYLFKKNINTNEKEKEIIDKLLYLLNKKKHIISYNYNKIYNK